MIYRMTIDNFDLFFPRQIASRGRNYFRNSRVKTLEKRGDGKYHATVKGSLRKYDVLVDIEKSGTINDISCSCPYDYGYCKHEYAVLMCLENIFDNEIAELSSDSVYKLISEYSYKLESKNEMPVNIEPEIFLNNDKLSFRLRIGRDRKYLISDINKLVDAFKYNSIKKYGKNFEWKHDISAIDIKSRRLMELAFEIFRDSRSDYRNMNFNKEKEFWLKDSYLERFFEIFEYGQLNISGDTYTFSDKAPYIKASLKTSQNGRMKFSASECPLFLGSAEKGYFLSEEEHTIYIADGDYTRSVSPLLKALGSSGELFVSKNDIPAFYNTVIRQVDDYLDIDISSLDDDIIPPQLISQLYIDVDEDDVICAALQFSYGNVFYSALKRIPDYIYADKYGEENALSIVCRYFELDSTDDVHPFKISNDDDAFRLINEGVTLLSKNMELYVSDRFRAISIRRSVRTNVGIRPSGSLLEMDISATGYNMQELSELLNAYRKGKKYHRFKDGSFSIVDDSIKDLDLLTKELNISDKAFLKEHISVPMYRMLYLNSMQTDKEHIRIQRSSEFKQYAKNYENALRDEEMFSIPSELDNKMRDYQKYGFRWMKTLGMYHMGGILADDMGLGKTLQAISVMLSEKEQSSDDTGKQFIVICPSSLTLNWQSEIEKFAPQLHSVCLSGTITERSKIFENIGEYDVIITSYATVLRDIDKYEELHFAAQFLDEAQNIKNHNTQSAKAVKSIKSDLRFALTGTPVENTLAELWSIFDFIMPGYLHNYSYFKKNYETPIVKKNDQDSVRSLQRLTSPFILRRMKSEVLTELPDKTETVLITEMEEKQKKLYIANAAKIKGELKELDGAKDKIKILAMLTRLRQLCCDPSLVYEDYDGGSAKSEQCIELIKNCLDSGHKILLFSQFTSMLDIIGDRLTQDGISFYMLTGATKTKERLRLVNEFNNNDVCVFLISLKAGGTGLNLTGADIVIHYDPWWNLSAENQASDRVYRIGQKNNVQIYKLIVKDTVEEKIRALQQKKAELMETAVGGEGDIVNMSAEDIIGLL